MTATSSTIVVLLTRLLLSVDLLVVDVCVDPPCFSADTKRLLTCREQLTRQTLTGAQG